MAKRFEGIYPPTITSFTDNGDIYEEGIRHVIRYLMSEGVHGFFINGSYASFALMTSDERKRVAEIIHDEVSGRLPIITHVGDSIHPGDDRACQTRRRSRFSGGGGRRAFLLFRGERLRRGADDPPLCRDCGLGPLADLHL